MPELYDDIKETPPVPEENETQIVEKLFKYIDEEHNPTRPAYLETIKKCYRFKELEQWDEIDVSALAMYGVPPIAVDRINRGLDTIDGIRENTDLRKKIIKTEIGDESVATLLDKVFDHFETKGDFDEPREDSFLSMLDTGIGIRKTGFDFGKRRMWTEYVNTEDFFWSKCKSKRLLDASWFVHKQTVGWEVAASMWPEKAGEIKGLKSKLESEWEKLNQSSSTPVTSQNRDYGSNRFANAPHPDQVDIYEFWLKRIIPFAKVGFQETTEQIIGGVPIPVMKPSVRKEPVDYQAQEGEQILEYDSDEIWEQYILASGGDRKNSIIVAKGQDTEHPFIACCAERKKNGNPRGYVEITIPHQVRINLAWAQKVAYNNKSIKSPYVTRGVTNMDKLIAQSQIGAILNLTGQEEVLNINTQLPLNTQAIEEGNQARMDMDFAAAATEQPMRGVAASGDSGIKFSLQQNAAITPLNKWVKAFEKSEREFVLKVLRMIIRYVSPQEMMRIVGQTMFMQLGLQVSPQGQIVSPDGQVLDLSVLDYDVRMENQAVSDFNKQQSFNAIEALVGGGVPLTDEFRIKNAPIKNTDDALLANQQARQDILRMLFAENEMLKAQMGEMEKQIPKGNQTSNATRGKNAPQAGRRSMPGGQGTKTVFGAK